MKRRLIYLGKEMRKNSRKLVVIGLILAFVYVGVQIINNLTDHKWKLNDPSSVYTIHGSNNYDRGETYYLYREKNGQREVIVIDPSSSVDFRHLTDRPLKINGYMIKLNDGRQAIKITFAQRTE